MMSRGLFLHILFFTLLTSQAVILEHPQNLAVVEGHPTELCCEVQNNEDPIEWHTYSSNIPTVGKTVRITDGYRNRYFLAKNGDKYTLYINATMVLDSGVYFCVSGMSKSQNATLRVLPLNWIPTCTSNPPDVSFDVGQNLDIKCISNGDMATSLLWMRNNKVIKSAMRSVNGSTVTLQASVTISDEAEVFICEASLPNVQSSEICVLRSNKVKDVTSGAQYVAYIIVIVLSVIVVILFIIMIVVILRQRQCRYCQRQPPPPQTVLDMDQLQSGLGPGLTDLINWDSNSIGSAMDLQGSEPPPDVVPTVYRRGNFTQASPTSTLRHNMDSAELEAEKPGVKTPKIQSLKRRSNGSRESTHPTTSVDQQPSTSGAGNNRNKGSFNDLGTLQKDRLYKKNKVVSQKRERTLSDDNNTTEANIDNISLNIKHEEHIL